MNITNPWLTPLQRSYQQIKSKLVDQLKNLKGPDGQTLITDVSEGNILVLILSIFSAVAEVIHYYIDNMARETFLTTSRRYDSLVKHAKLVDYHPHGATPSTADVVISRPLNSAYISSIVNITKGLVFTDNQGNTWEVAKDRVWEANTTNTVVPLIQRSLYEDNNIIGSIIPTISSDSVLVIPVPTLGNGQYYAHNTMTLSINDEDWVLVETFAFSGPTDKHFITEVDANQNLNIVFGDGLHGMIPEPGYQITNCTYYITRGDIGNVLEGTITNIPIEIRESVADAVCSNPNPSSGGTGYETFNKLKQNIPLHVRTMGIAVTKQDFIDLAKQVPGVNKVALEYECGRKLNIYITPDNGVVASSTLLENTYEVLKQHSPITTWLNVKPVGQVDIILDIDVTGKKSYSSSEIQSQILEALMNTYSIDNAEIGGKVRISDIYALIDNLTSVDFLHINSFYIKPWPTTVIGNNKLRIEDYIVYEAIGSSKYLVVIISSTEYLLYSIKGGYSSKNLIGQSTIITDNINKLKFGITVVDNDYNIGDKFTFVVSAPNVDYVEPGYNLPVFINKDQLRLKVNEVL